MSLWAALAGGANEYLRQSQVKDEEERFLKKQELLAKLQEEQDFKKEQRAAERQRDRDNMAAESQRLERDARRAEKEEDRSFRREENEKALALRAKELAMSREDRAAAREDQKAWRQEQSASQEEYRAEKGVTDLMSQLTSDSVKDSEAKNAARLIYGSSLPAQEKLARLRSLIGRMGLDTSEIMQ